MTASARIDRRTFVTGLGVLVVGFGAAACASPAVQPKPHGASEANPLGPVTYPQVDSWLALDAQGNVTITFGKVELGTGVETAIAQLVADELAVPIARVHVVQGDTARTPNQGYTAGSQTLTSGSIPVRQAAAEARSVMIALGAQHFGVPAGRLTTRAGAVAVNGSPARTVSYAALLHGRRFERTIPAHPPMRPAKDYEYIGKPIARVDIPGKVTGPFPYVHNLRLPGMLHARVVLPPGPGAKLSAYDVASLGDLPEKVRVVREGDILAVVATSEWNAVRAAQQLAVTWKPGPELPVYADLWDTVRKTPGADRVLIESGDVDGTIKSAARTLTARYEWPFQSHGSIGPSCAVADVRAHRAEIWSATQGVFPLRGAIAELLGLAPKAVRVRYAEGSGCYGHNGADDAAAFAAVISQAVHAPVRVQYMRGDETAHDPKGPAMVHEYRGALAPDGSIAAWDAHVWTPTHSGRPDGKAANTLPGILRGAAAAAVTFVGGDRDAPNNYAIPAQRVTITDQKTAVLRQSALRGLGGTQNTFANESFIDELAHLAAADPFAFRLRHLRDARARAVLEALRADYRRGRGVAFVRYENTQALVAAVADVSVDRRSGAVRINQLWIAHDCGLIVNPDGLRNQIEGNAIQAASRALKEEVRFDPQHVTSVDWASYPILRFEEIPDVMIRTIDRAQERILGAGEATTTVIAPAIANAVFAQTGARLRRVPFTPDAVLGALSGDAKKT